MRRFSIGRRLFQNLDNENGKLTMQQLKAMNEFNKTNLQKKANKVAHTDRQIEILKLEAQLEDISARLVDLKVILEKLNQMNDNDKLTFSINDNTLLPTRFAQSITAIALSTKFSLRTAAFLIELFLDGFRNTTTSSIDIARRATITAINSALRRYDPSSDYIDLDKLSLSTGLAALGINCSSTANPDEVHRKLLEGYTGLGIYVVHHSFTLAELFAHAGFYLTQKTIKTSFTLAQDSVSVFDGVFGSNECPQTSRALSSIISFMSKENEAPKNMSYMSWVVALTKAFTAFACLQNATQKRILESQNMKVVWDCVVVNRTMDSNPTPTMEKKPKSVGDTLAGLAAVLESYRYKNVSSSGSSLSTSSRTQSPASQPDHGRSMEHSIMKKKSGNMLSSREAKTSREYHKRNLSNDERKDLITTLTELLGETYVNDNRLDEVCDCDNSDTIKKTIWEMITENEEQIVTTETRNMNFNGLNNEYNDLNGELNGKTHNQTNTVQFPVEPQSAPQTPYQVAQNQSISYFPSYSSTSCLPSLTTEKQRFSIASESYADALSHPGESKEKLQNVLRTVTTRLTQRHVARKIEINGLEPTNYKLSRKMSTPELRMTHINNHKSGTPLQNTKSHQRNKSIGTHTHPNQIMNDKEYLDNTINNVQNAADNLALPQFSNIDEQPIAPPSSPVCRANHVTEETLPHMRRIMHQPRAEPVKDAVEETSQGVYWPRQHIVKNIHRFMRYSSAAYGKSFMRILGIGKCDWDKLPLGEGDHHANHHAFAYHNNISIDAILLSSYTDPPVGFNSDDNKICPLVHYVAVDHDAKSIVLTCRGTLGFQDILVDLTCNYQEFELDGGGDPFGYYAIHQGMLISAHRLASESNTVLSTIRKALSDFPEYGLVLCGHSLGGGAAAALALIWGTRTDVFNKQAKEKGIPFDDVHSTSFVTGFKSGLPPGRPLSCYTYGTPCVSTPDLTAYAKGLIISVVNNKDIVPTLSLGLLHDMRKLALMLHEEEGNIADEIIGRVLGFGGPHRSDDTYEKPNLDQVNEKLRDHDQIVSFISKEDAKIGHTSNAILKPGYIDPALIKADTVNHDNELNDWLWSLKTTIGADMDSIKLYPPGEVFVVERSTCFVSLAEDEGDGNEGYSSAYKQEAHRVILRYCQNVEKRFNEPFFSKSMFTDHSPVEYERATQLLFDGIAG
ncbi:hypothetical protein E3Q18_03902 [Wallemia mellicola]|uniref:sn-1-specific diacylglycerol lipase n=1 Tax=Wallemia mellicola TaxID=1708541 RepID=A0A4T0TBY6_9BASI|nr:hypothetical protein E3Q19_02842 [Wallemia mellicola]TIB95206.1 hypothetical protein E3Q18_03902 [Wallemia mellicola]TIC08854.1 hypothetical protein E3Q15_03790 [Wallemia mellicola]TIC25316.1 hypothetical protein E3Q10_03796 [Wallemia mellicola]TIC62048.1 hypothetical protein E3Q01_04157 [Wallemia mellicola]